MWRPSPPSPPFRGGSVYTATDVSDGVTLTQASVTFTAAPIAALNPTSLSFGTLNVSTSSSPFTTTLSNAGAATLSISSISISGSNPADFARTTDCGATLVPGVAGSISVTFTALATGSRAATLSVSDNATGSPHTAPLSGIGSNVILTPASYSGTISAATAGGTYKALTGPMLAEQSGGSIGTGTIVLTAPAGFEFDTGGTAPTVKNTAGSSNQNQNINQTPVTNSISLTVSPNTLTLTITSVSAGCSGCENTLSWQNVRVRPTAGTSLASGNITNTGTSAGAPSSITN